MSYSEGQISKNVDMPGHQDTGQNYTINIGNKSVESVEHFRCLGTALTNQNSIHEEIKDKLNWRNVSYHSVQNLLSFSLLSKNIKVKGQKIVILPVFCISVKPGLLHWERVIG
jgi:hypothetical protein